ncbi:hypothetical protein PQR33_07295 [Paraburkholderia sediminicola]|uniref:hypothetical protein n=1 Tax=Paraburkholderia sediminicola TaxID=458836 RepID=UPI0038BC8AF9
MKAIWQLALDNPALLVVPALALAFSLVMLRIKKRYVNEGILFRRKPAAERDPGALKQGGEMNAGKDIDLENALRKFQQLGLEDGDLGYEYWHAVGKLLKRAAGMRQEIESLSRELEQCRAMQRKKHRSSGSSSHAHRAKS